MFIMISGILIGVILGVLALLIGAKKPSLLGWLVLAFGVVALITILPSIIAVIRPIQFGFSPIFSIVTGIACMVSGIGAVVRHSNRSWQVWLGLVLGGLPILFWLLFAIGEIVFPH